MPRCFLMLFVLIAANLAAADFELTGVITTDGQTKLSFRETRTGASRWVNIGGSIGGYRVVEFDRTDDSVVLSRDGKITRQKLVETGPGGGQSEQTIAFVEDSIRQNPTSGELELYLGRLLRDKGQTREAFAHFLLALRKGHLLRPATVHELVAYTGYDLGEYDDALRSIVALESTPEGKADPQLPHLKRAIINFKAQRDRAAAPEKVKK